MAIVHDWLVTYAGSERVLEQLIALYPQADIFALIDFLPDGQRSFLGGKQVTTSFLQRLPGVRKHYQRYLPLMPLAVEQFDLAGYDVVISSSHCVAKGVITGPDQLHVSYVHTPMRYAWDAQQEYLAGAGLDRGLRGGLARYLLHRLRLWDATSAQRVDAFAANSAFIAGRIEKAYRRPARVIYPPVDTESFRAATDRGDYYVTASRLVPYKRVDLLVEAFARMPQRRLVVVGDGPQLAALRAKAPPNVSLVGYQGFEVLRLHLERAAAFLYAASEDFGIVLAEAQASGCPVIALGRGGAAEIVRGLDHQQPTGVLFDEQTSAAVVGAVETFERYRGRMAPDACRENGLRFSVERFQSEMRDYVDESWQQFRHARARHLETTGRPGTLRAA